MLQQSGLLIQKPGLATGAPGCPRGVAAMAPDVGFFGVRKGRHCLLYLSGEPEKIAEIVPIGRAIGSKKLTISKVPAAAGRP